MTLSIVLGICCYAFLAIDHFLRLSGSVNLAVVFKGIASLCFLSLAIYSFVTCKKKSDAFRRLSVFVLTGIFLAFVADIILEINFVFGFVLFVFAQFFYFFAFIGYGKLKPRFFIISAAIIITLIIFDVASPFFNFEKDGESLFLPSVVYMISLTIVVVQGFECFGYKDIRAKLMPIGTLLFALSDLLLETYVFPSGIIPKNLAEVIFIFSNFMYYTGQLFVAFSLSKDYLVEKK